VGWGSSGVAPTAPVVVPANTVGRSRGNTKEDEVQMKVKLRQSVQVVKPLQTLTSVGEGGSGVASTDPVVLPPNTIPRARGNTKGAEGRMVKLRQVCPIVGCGSSGATPPTGVDVLADTIPRARGNTITKGAEEQIVKLRQSDTNLDRV